jgi:hypothetical protein
MRGIPPLDVRHLKNVFLTPPPPLSQKMFGKKCLEVLFSQENVDLPPSTMHVHAITVPFRRNFHLRVRGGERQKCSSE